MPSEEQSGDNESGEEFSDPETQPPTAAKDQNSDKRILKRKRKKRKKKPGTTSAAQDSPAQPSVASKQVADSRFAAALEQLQRNSPDCTWTRLDSCNIFDAKTRKIAEALRNNTEITSLDLSSNGIGSAGGQALAKALLSGHAPELILLDLRSNPFSEDVISELEAVQKNRRELKIELGALGERTGQDANGAEPCTDPDGHEMVEMQSSTAGPAPQNGFLQRFFQVGNGGGAHEAAEPASEPEEDAEVVSSRLWDQVSAVLDTPSPSIAGLSSNLRRCVLGISREMDTSATPLLSSTRLDDLRPFTRAAVDNLQLLQAVLDVPAPLQFAPHSKDTPMAAAGSHCAAAAQLVERLCYGRSAAISTHILRAGLLSRLLPLCFEYPLNNILQSACCETIKWALESGLRVLWEPLFRPRMGAPKGKPPGDRGNLAERLVDVLKAAHEAPTCALRPCHAGFALNVARQLRDGAAESDALERALEESRGWEQFAKSGGLLDELLAEQSGGLCGPRPSRPPALSGMGIGQSSDSNGASSSLVDGEELLKLLSQSVHGMHVSEDDPGNDDDDEDEEDFLEEQDRLQLLIDNGGVLEDARDVCDLD